MNNHMYHIISNSQLLSIELLLLFFGTIVSLLLCASVVHLLKKSQVTTRLRNIIYLATSLEWLFICSYFGIKIVRDFLYPNYSLLQPIISISAIVIIVLLISKIVSDIYLIPALINLPTNIHKNRIGKETVVLRYGTLFAQVIVLSSWYTLVAILATQNSSAPKSLLVIFYVLFIFVGVVSIVFFEDNLNNKIKNKNYYPKLSNWSIFK